jgi:hypothetical protein
MYTPKFSVASSRLNALRRNIPKEVSEDLVGNYHAIVDDLQAGCGEDLSSFRIDDGDLEKKIIPMPFVLGGGAPMPAPFYTDKRFCDTNLFTRQIEALSDYLRSLPGTPTASTTGYSKLSDDDLQELAFKGRFRAHADGTTKVDREMVIAELTRREKGAGSHVSNIHNTIHIGQMTGSSIQQNSPGANANVNNNSPELNTIIDALRSIIPGLNADDQNILKSDVATMDLQVASGRSKSVIVRECLISARGVLEKMAGSIAATGVLHEISNYLQHHP